MNALAIQAFANAMQAAARGTSAGDVTLSTTTYTAAQGVSVFLHAASWKPRPDGGGVVLVQTLEAWIPKSILATRPSEKQKIVYNHQEFKVAEVDGDLPLSTFWHITAYDWLD